jgi:hypothetical protein
MLDVLSMEGLGVGSLGIESLCDFNGKRLSELHGSALREQARLGQPVWNVDEASIARAFDMNAQTVRD